METMSLQFLVEKLNALCKRSLEAAAAACVSRTNYNVEIEHWLLKLLETPGSDAQAIFRQYEVDTSRLLRDLNNTMDQFDRGNARTPPLSKHLVQLVREAWLIASTKFNETQIRSAFLILALRTEESLARMADAASAELEKIPGEELGKNLLNIVARTNEAPAVTRAGPPGARSSPGRVQGTPALDQFTIDLTDRARAGKLDPVFGRDMEIRQIIDILTRRRQNNPILTGEAGVGKTAVVEGFALRVAGGDVPLPLKNVTVRTLDLGLLQAGAGVKGEFENRLKSVIDEVKASSVPIVLFIDEAHTMIGAGGQAGQNDAANLLKPALARGELRTIAATTWAEYKKYFEQDAALARRFQVVKIEEPSEEATVGMLQGLVQTLEDHHDVRILDEGLVGAVRLSHRYLSGRQLPDKAVSLLDTACARVSLSQTATPAGVEDCERTVQQSEISIGILERENAAGVDHRARIAALKDAQQAAQTQLTALKTRWQEELRLVREIRRLRDLLAGAKPRAGKGVPAPGPGSSPKDTSPPADSSAQGAPKAPPDGQPPAAGEPSPPTDPDRLREQFADLGLELAKLQGETPLVHVFVDAQAVAEIVAAWTGIPVGRMVRNEINAVLSLKEHLEERIIGQSPALAALARRIFTARAGLTDPRRPIGVFLLVGPSGVGKTETALCLAELLYGGTQNMTVINMSEFKEEHKVSLLMGSPPGYVGYGEGGVLTEAVRRKPYSVVLLDELEKAHPSVHDIFYQVFDKGTLQDGQGRMIDFKNTVVLMTSNAGTELITKLCADAETRPDSDRLAELLHPELLKTFKPAFLGRTTILPYYTLGDEVMRRIVELKLRQLAQRVRESHNATFTYTPQLVQTVAARCTEVDTGARNVDHILTRTLLPEMSTRFLSRMADGQPITSASVSVDEAGNFLYEIK